MYNWFNYSRLKRQFENQLKENAKLREENKNFEDILNSIAEDGTHEHNNAIKLRGENVELTKEVLGLRHLKTENVELIEKINAVNKEIEALKLMHKEREAKLKTYNGALLGQISGLKEENEKLNLQIVALHKIIEGAKTTIDEQKHPMYPLHWGGYDKNIIDFVESELNNQDPLEGEQLEFSSEDLLKKVAEDADYSGSTGYTVKQALSLLPKSFPNEYRETSWEDAAANLALKVVKLQRKIEELSAQNNS